MSGKSGHRATGHKPAGSTRTSAKTDGAFGKEGVAELVSETERNVDKTASHQEHLDSSDQSGAHQGAARKKTSEAEALHCPTCGRRFESEEGLRVHQTECSAASLATGTKTVNEKKEPADHFRTTP